MNEPLINPWIFYFMDVGGSMKCVFGGLLMATAAVTITATILAVLEDSKEGKRWAKIGLVLCVLNSLLVCAIPSKNTILSMVIASYVTPKNIETVGGYTDKTLDKVIEKIIKAAKEMEKKE